MLTLTNDCDAVDLQTPVMDEPKQIDVDHDLRQVEEPNLRQEMKPREYSLSGRLGNDN